MERAAPGRLPDDQRVYAIGDVHGCADRLAAMHAAVAADLASRPIGRPLVVHLGDYVDRGPDSAGVVARLAAGAAIPTVSLMGNHERIMVDALGGDRAAATDWMIHGGRESLASWGVPAEAMPPAWRGPLPNPAWTAAIPADHLAYLAARPLSHMAGSYLFVHAGVRPGIHLDRQDPRDLLSIRQVFLTSERDFGAVVVHGHTVKPEPVVRHNRIGIDTGAVYGGKLTCVVLEQDRLDILQV